MEHKPEYTQKTARIERAVIYILCAALAILLIAAFVADRTRMGKARWLLTQARTVELAVLTVTSERTAKLETVYDAQEPYGFAEGIEEEIRQLSGCEGVVYLLGWDADSCHASALMYIEGELCAMYIYDAETGGTWSVYRHDELISP